MQSKCGRALLVELKERQSDRYGLGIYYEVLGKWYERPENPDHNDQQALRAQAESLRYKTGMHSESMRGLILSHCSRARVLARLGKPAEADDELNHAQKLIASQKRDPEMQVEFHYTAGVVLSRAGALESARDALVKSQRAADARGLRRRGKDINELLATLQVCREVRRHDVFILGTEAVG